MEATDEYVRGLDNVVITDMLRAVMSSMEGLLKAFPQMKQGIIFAGRNEEAGMDDDGGLLIATGYMELPRVTGKDTVIVTNPTFVIGSTVCPVPSRILENTDIDPGELFVLSAVSAPDDLLRVDDEFPKVGPLAVAIDNYPGNDGYIVPGLGGVGDRMLYTM